MNKIHELPKYCLVCGSVEVFEPIKYLLNTDEGFEWFGVYLCEDHKKSTPEQIQDIIGDNIKMNNFNV